MKTRIVLFLILALLIASPLHAQMAPKFIKAWGSYGTGDGQFSWPGGIAVDENGNVYIADTGNCRIQKFDKDGIFITKWGKEGTEEGYFIWPNAIAIDKDGYVYVLESGEKIEKYGRIQKFTGDGEFIMQWGSLVDGTDQFKEGSAITIDMNGDILVSDSGYHRIVRYTNTGKYIGSFGSFGSGDGQFNCPQGITIDEFGNRYIADGRNIRVQKFDSKWNFICKWTAYACEPGKPPAPLAVAVDRHSNVYVVCNYNWPDVSKCKMIDLRYLLQFDDQGNLIDKWAPYGGEDEYFRGPKAIAVDNNNSLYVLDSGNNRIQVFKQAGPAKTPTPVGQNVQVPLIDSYSGDSYITLGFDSVTTEGLSEMTTLGSFPPQPYDFYKGSGPSFFDITTDAQYIGFIDICISYKPQWFKDDSMLKLFHWDGTHWFDCTTSLDTEENFICGRVSSFSIFGLFTPRSPYGTVTGNILADCPIMDTPLAGVLVDAFQLKYADMIASAVTDSAGQYTFANLPDSGYYITMIPPIGYSTEREQIYVKVEAKKTYVVDFALSCIQTVSCPRSIGFWKHQFAVAIGGKGHAEIDADSLCGYLDLISAHFNSNHLNPVIVYQPPSWGECLEKLLIAKDILNLWGSQEMIIRAQQQLMAVLLNVSAQYLPLNKVISEDGATVSQAITYCDNLIDNPSGDFELAKNICDLINNDKTVAAGMIPLNTVQIAYSPPVQLTDIPVEPYLDQNYPNPFNPTTRIAYGISKNSHVQISIYNVLGQRVATLVNRDRMAGNYSVEWHGQDDNGAPVASGIYFYKVVAGDFVSVRKLVLLK